MIFKIHTTTSTWIVPRVPLHFAWDSCPSTNQQLLLLAVTHEFEWELFTTCARSAIYFLCHGWHILMSRLYWSCCSSVSQNPLPFPIRITKPAATADLIYIDIEVYFSPEGGTMASYSWYSFIVDELLLGFTVIHSLHFHYRLREPQRLSCSQIN